MNPFLSLTALCLIAAVLLYALHRKGDVRADFKLPFVEFSLDAKDRNADTKSVAAPKPPQEDAEKPSVAQISNRQ
jgi:hypothetical protein